MDRARSVKGHSVGVVQFEKRQSSFDFPQDCIAIWASRSRGQDSLNEFSSRESTTEMNSPRIPLGDQNRPDA